jgi:hypothetical protein
MATLTISFTVPTAQQVSDITDDFCAYNGYNSATDGTKAAFVKLKLAQKIKNDVMAYRVANAERAAIESAAATADSNTQLT